MEAAPGDVVEVELKAHVRDADGLREALEARRGRHVGTSVERDTYFAHPARDFAATDEALRLRQVDGSTELTYKGPRQDAATKTRREVTFAVPAGEARALLEALGFSAVATVVKRRETYALDALTVTLDDVEGLGTFAEIERVVDEEDVDAARAEVVAMADALGLQERTTTSYMEMVLEARRP